MQRVITLLKTPKDFGNVIFALSGVFGGVPFLFTAMRGMSVPMKK